MSTLDWIVVSAFIVFSVLYGMLKGRGSRTTRSYMLADKSMPWYAVALSIMATQASAITFVSTTGQGYADGMRFVQFYFGLPVAMVVLCAVAVPIFHRLNIYTAYEYLEQRFDLKTRALTAMLFLVQRSLATGLSLYASAIILSVVMGWNIHWTLWIIGVVIIAYTTVGGVKGVNWNDFQQFIVIAAGMAAACIVTVRMLPPEVSFLDAVSLTGAMGKMKAVDYSFDWQNRYNFWSGLIGGAFLALSYFGTDQSQVQRYLTGSSITQSRLGLLFNGLAKVPMQFCILFVGVMVFAFYQFVPPPLFFNPEEVRKISASPYAAQYHELENQYRVVAADQEQLARSWLASRGTAGESEARTRMLEAKNHMDGMRNQATDLMQKNDADANPSDTNYIFLSFVLRHLPAGLVGLVVVVILAATMSSSASALNSLATTTVIDVYRRLVRTEAQDRHYLQVTRGSTIFWGVFAVLLSERVSRLGSLVEAVNILGSLFYGTVLGIFMLAFFFRRIRGTSAFLAAIVGEALVIYLFLFTKISFLWYNVFGCLAVIAAAFLLQPLLPAKSR